MIGHDLRASGADRLELLGAGQAHGDDGHAGGQRQVRDAGATAVEAAVARAGALGVDAERLAAAEHLERGVEAVDAALLSSRSTGSIPRPSNHARDIAPFTRCR